MYGTGAIPRSPPIVIPVLHPTSEQRTINELITPHPPNSDPILHLNAPQIKSYDVISRQNLKRLRKENDYIEVPSDMFENLLADVAILKSCVLSTQTQVETLITQNENLKSELQIVKKSVQQNKPHGKTTYADKVKSNDPVVVILPKNKEQTSSATKSDIKNKLSPTNLAVKNIRKAAKGAIVIECENTKSQTSIKESVINKLSSEYNVSIPELLNPRFKIINVSEKYSDEQILCYIKKQNEFIPSSSNFKCIKLIQTPRANYTYIIETDPATYNLIISNEKLSIGWDRCRVFENIYVRRCFKCLGFNHKSDECSKEKVCLKCSGHHDIKQCQSTKVECVNCKWAVENLRITLDVNHQANSYECPVLQHRMDRARQRILVEK